MGSSFSQRSREKLVCKAYRFLAFSVDLGSGDAFFSFEGGFVIEDIDFSIRSIDLVFSNFWARRLIWFDVCFIIS